MDTDEVNNPKTEQFRRRVIQHLEAMNRRTNPSLTKVQESYKHYFGKLIKSIMQIKNGQYDFVDRTSKESQPAAE